MIAFRSARPEEAAALTELCLCAKAVWGYGEDFIAACRAELTLTPDQIAGSRVRVAEEEGELVGMAELHFDRGTAQLDKLYIAPTALRRGAGRALFLWALAEARRAGATEMTIDADPNAADFYRRMGASDDGLVPSGSIPGRRLPRLKLNLSR